LASSFSSSVWMVRLKKAMSAKLFIDRLSPSTSEPISVSSHFCGYSYPPRINYLHTSSRDCLLCDHARTRFPDRPDQTLFFDLAVSHLYPAFIPLTVLQDFREFLRSC
jgi:hypothetical protein